MITKTTTIEIRIVETFTGMPEGPESFGSEAEFADWLNHRPKLIKGEAGWTDYLSLHNDFDELAVYTARACHVDQVEALARYFLEGLFAGECYGVTSPDAVDGWGHLFVISTDSTKSMRSDWTLHMDELWRILREGSPVRMTDKTGPAGTRAVEGLRCDLWLAFR